MARSSQCNSGAAHSVIDWPDCRPSSLEPTAGRVPSVSAESRETHLVQMSEGGFREGPLSESAQNSVCDWRGCRRPREIAADSADSAGKRLDTCRHRPRRGPIPSHGGNPIGEGHGRDGIENCRTDHARKIRIEALAVHRAHTAGR